MNPVAEKLAWQEALLSDPKLNNAARVLGAYLMHRLDGKTLQVSISAETLAQDLDWSLSKTKRAIDMLRDTWFRICRGRNGSNRYYLLDDRVAMCAERMRQLRQRRAYERRIVENRRTKSKIETAPVSKLGKRRFKFDTHSHDSPFPYPFKIAGSGQLERGTAIGEETDY